MAERKLGPRARANLAARKGGASLACVTEVQMRFAKPQRFESPSFKPVGIEVKLYFPVRTQKQADRLMKAFSRRCGHYDLAGALAVKP